MPLIDLDFSGVFYLILAILPSYKSLKTLFNVERIRFVFQKL
jgi:hypothetical protein